MFQSSRYALRRQKPPKLDEYDFWDRLGMRGVWKLKKSTTGWFPRPFPELSSAEIVTTIDAAPKLNVTNRDFWQRAAEACKASYFSFNPTQLTAVVHAFMQAKYYDRQLLEFLARAAIRSVHVFRPNDLAVLLKGFSWLGHRDEVLLDAAARALTCPQRGIPCQGVVSPKGCALILQAYARLERAHKTLFLVIAAAARNVWPSGSEHHVASVRAVAVLCETERKRCLFTRTLATPDHLLDGNVGARAVAVGDRDDVAAGSGRASEIFRAAGGATSRSSSDERNIEDMDTMQHRPDFFAADSAAAFDGTYVSAGGQESEELLHSPGVAARRRALVDAEVVQAWVDVVHEKVVIPLLEAEAFVSLVWSMAQFAKAQRWNQRESAAIAIAIPEATVAEIMHRAPKLLYATASGGEASAAQGSANHLPVLFEALVELVGPTLARHELERQRERRLQAEHAKLEEERAKRAKAYFEEHRIAAGRGGPPPNELRKKAGAKGGTKVEAHKRRKGGASNDPQPHHAQMKRARTIVGVSADVDFGGDAIFPDDLNATSSSSRTGGALAAAADEDVFRSPAAPETYHRAAPEVRIGLDKYNEDVDGVDDPRCLGTNSCRETRDNHAAPPSFPENKNTVLKERLISKLTQEEASSPYRVYAANRFYEGHNIVEALRNAIYRKIPSLSVAQLNRCLLAMDRLSRIIAAEKMSASSAESSSEKENDDEVDEGAATSENAVLDPFTREMIISVLPRKVEHLSRERVLDVLSQLPDQQYVTGVAPLILHAMVEHYEFPHEDLVFVSELLRRAFPRDRSRTRTSTTAREVFERRVLDAHIGSRVATSATGAEQAAQSGDELQILPEHIRFAILEDATILADYPHENSPVTFSADAIALAIIQHAAHERCTYWVNRRLDLSAVSPALLPAVLSVVATKYARYCAEAEDFLQLESKGLNRSTTNLSDSLADKSNCCSEIIPYSRVLEICQRVDERIAAFPPRAIVVAVKSAALVLPPDHGVLQQWTQSLTHHCATTRPIHVCQVAIALRDSLLDLSAVRGRTKAARGPSKSTTGQLPLCDTISAPNSTPDLNFDYTMDTAKRRLQEILHLLRLAYLQALCDLPHAEDFLTALRFYSDNFREPRIGDGQLVSRLNAKLVRVQETLQGWKKQLDLQKACERAGLTLEEKILPLSPGGTGGENAAGIRELMFPDQDDRYVAATTDIIGGGEGEEEDEHEDIGEDDEDGESTTGSDSAEVEAGLVEEGV